MRKINLAVIGLAVLVLGGCGIGKGGTIAEEKIKKSLRDLITAGQTQKCTFKSQTEEGETVTEMWIKGKKFKQTTMINGGTNGTNYVVSDGEWVYSWNSRDGKAIKMKLEEPKETGGGGEEVVKTEKEVVDWDQELDYECKAETVGDSEFVPPSGIEFIDFAAEMESYKGKMEDLVKQYGGNIPTGTE